MYGEKFHSYEVIAKSGGLKPPCPLYSATYDTHYSYIVFIVQPQLIVVSRARLFPPPQIIKTEKSGLARETKLIATMIY